uniref:Uncharacterized protein n=1 Tax=Panagrolaimus sp. JU765 TaxID=591449 RepID=A0AC34QW57_9BILA
MVCNNGIEGILESKSQSRRIRPNEVINKFVRQILKEPFDIETLSTFSSSLNSSKFVSFPLEVFDELHNSVLSCLPVDQSDELRTSCLCRMQMRDTLVVLFKDSRTKMEEAAATVQKE